MTSTISSSRNRSRSCCCTFAHRSIRAQSRTSIVAQNANQSARNLGCRKELSQKERAVVAYKIPQVVAWRACEVSEPWMELHKQLLSIAKRRAALDSEELALIREAIRVTLWRRLGMVSMREYLEHAMGYGPQVASERLRVAEALDALPAIEDALASGELSYSAVRELTRIATPRTEEAWLDACEGKNLRQIEELVAEREHGDAPGDEPKPDVRPQRVSMMLRPAARAALRSARQAIEAERGERIDDSELIEQLCRAYLGGGSNEAPKAQIAITTCDGCKQARQHAAGRDIALTDAEYEEAACDARFIGTLDGSPQRATSAVPPATERAVRQRDKHRCTVPGCRSVQFLHVHHIVWRSRGGGHEMENLTTLCGGHHGALHRGEITITGKAPTIVVTRAFEVPHVGESQRSRAVHGVGPMADDARLVLTTLGFSAREAREAVAGALEELGLSASLEQLVRTALRRCPRPLTG
jgi:hypothetical protein